MLRTGVVHLARVREVPVAVPVLLVPGPVAGLAQCPLLVSPRRRDARPVPVLLLRPGQAVAAVLSNCRDLCPTTVPLANSTTASRKNVHAHAVSGPCYTHATPHRLLDSGVCSRQSKSFPHSEQRFPARTPPIAGYPQNRH